MNGDDTMDSTACGAAFFRAAETLMDSLVSFCG
jgi:hypothetical protein